MGCVLGTGARSDRRSNSKSNRRNEDESQSQSTTSTQTRHNVEQVASDRVRVEKKVRQTSGDVQATDRRRLKPQFSLNTSPTWPEWLSAVAGDAIKDWKPRRANTFEKLDKVNIKVYVIISSIIHINDLNIDAWMQIFI